MTQHERRMSNIDNQPIAAASVTEGKTIRALEDNRPSSLLQKKRIETDAIPMLTIQQKTNNTGLPDNLKSGIENLSGHSMDDVKVHYNSSQPVQLNAHAYAQGSNIHLAPGQEKHLPHEAWHVVQQKQGRVKPTLQMKGKVNVNDDKGLEKEADIMGSKAISIAVAQFSKSNGQKKNCSTLDLSPVQYVKKKGKLTEEQRAVNSWNNKNKREKKLEKSQAVANSTNKGQLVLVPTGSNEFNEVKNKIEKNVSDVPYKTDAFHETQPLMQGIMHAKGAFQKIFAAKSALLNVGGGKSFTVNVTSVYRIVNPKTRKEAFEKARFVGKYESPKKHRELYAGHGKVVTDAVIGGGYLPALGSHDTQKGFGALGRGAYFSDQAAKAATYGGLGLLTGGTLIISDVIEGNQKVIDNGKNERHKTHNSMVKRPAHAGNVIVPVPIGHESSDIVEDESGYDSIMGRKTYAPGAGSFRAIYNRNVFDSNEILIRNADQILPKYKIQYTVKF